MTKKNFKTKAGDKRFRPYDDNKIEKPETRSDMEKGRGIKRGKGKRSAAVGNNTISPRYRGTNDVRWYSSNDQLLRDVAKLSFANPAGTNIPLALSDGTYANTANDLVERLPGVMTISCVPTFGINTDASSPLNQGAQLLYNTIRSENSGARNYDAPDLMHYIIGVDSLFIYYAQMLRVYGTINHFRFMNKYTPRTLIHAMGYDYDSIVNNMAQFRSYINTFAKRLSSYIMPHNITIVERHFNMFGRVYKDAENPKAQFYMYVPTCVWKYNAVGSTTGAAMTPLAMRPAGGLMSTAPGYSFADIVRTGDDLLAGMNDEDTLTMAGDMLKAFGEANIWKQDYIDYDFTLDPVFDFTWLTQIQNLNSLDFPVTNATMGTALTGFFYHIDEVIPAAPNSPYLRTTCGIVSANPKLAHAKLLVSPYDDPSEGDVMESTRLALHCSCAYDSANTRWNVVVESCGAEVVNNVAIYTFINTASGLDVIKHNLAMSDIFSETQTSSILTLSRNFAQLDAFAMHPTQYTITYPASGTHTALTDYTIHLPIADIDNWTVLHNSTLDGLHKVALLSMLYVRNVGFYAKY